MRVAPAVLTVLLLAGCSSTGSSAPAALPAAPPRSPGPVGDLSEDALRGLLLQPADLPDLTARRVYASAELSTQFTPQLGLCLPVQPDAPHQIANVLAQSGRPGEANVFQVLSAYADEDAAQAAYDRVAEAARTCTSYTAQDVPYTVEDLADVPLPGGARGLHYRLSTPDVISGDVRTVVRYGRFVVLVTGYGAPTDGSPLLDLQAAAAAKAVARLG